MLLTCNFNKFNILVLLFSKTFPFTLLPVNIECVQIPLNPILSRKLRLLASNLCLKIDTMSNNK